MKPHPNGFLGPNQAGLSSTNTPKGLIAQGQKSLDSVNPNMAGQCRAGKLFKEVTLKGGINAGTYKDVGAVQNMDECSSKCCEFAACDLAFMLSNRCYLVGCSEGKNCQIQKAKPSPYHPSVTYIERWNKEGVKHTGKLRWIKYHVKKIAMGENGRGFRVIVSVFFLSSPPPLPRPCAPETKPSFQKDTRSYS